MGKIRVMPNLFRQPIIQRGYASHFFDFLILTFDFKKGVACGPVSALIANAGLAVI